MTRLPALIAQVLEACAAASAAILDEYRKDFSVAQKADRSPLTAADLASHRILVERLEQLTPEVPILSEESAEIEWTTRRDWRRLWIVDPLDGTREFIQRNGEFTINVALVEDHRAVLGVIAVPVFDQAYSGIPGQGAIRWHGLHQAAPKPEPIHSRKPTPDTPVVLGSRSHGNERSQAYFHKLGPHHRISRGSALKFCAIAAGEADFYPRLGPTSEWDTAAGQAIVEAAGGRVCLADGREMRYNARPSILNGDFLVAADPDHAWPAPPAA